MRAVVFFCMSFVISLVVVTYVVSGQTVEVCDNGIDDNGNGLVDCDDTACQPGFIRKNYFVIEKSGSTSGAIIEDFDNDGLIDVFVQGNGYVELMEVSEAYPLAFTSQTFDSVTNTNFRSFAEDVNADGLLDVFYSSSGSVKALVSNSQGQYETSDLIGFSNTLRGATLIDYDLDGDKDLFVVDSGQGSPVAIFNNDGNLNYSFDSNLPSGLPFPIRNISIKSADLNGDQIDDFVLLSQQYFVVFIATPTGFSATLWEHGFPTSYSSQNYGEIQFEDFNNDGALDLLLYISGINNGVKIFLNDGNGGVGSASFAAFSDSTAAINPTVVDFDSDGDLDFISRESLFVNDGGGDFTYEYMVQLGNVLTAGDVDQDGFVDQILRTDEGFILKYGKEIGRSISGNFYRGFLGSCSPGLYESPILLIGDQDLLTFDSFQNGDYELSQSLPVSFPDSVLVHDFDLDGDQDFLATHGGSLSVFSFNETTRQFELLQEINGVSNVAVGNFDSDSFLDLLIVGNCQADAVVWINAGHGFFIASGGFFSVCTSERPAIGDFDGDGIDDVAIFSSETGDVEVYLNNGLVFSQSWSNDDSFYIPRGFAADVNLDGFSDIVVNCRIYFSVGGENFVVSQISCAGAPTSALDINYDGLIDIYSSVDGVALINNGIGGFESRFGVPGEFLSDFDLDGDLDLILQKEETSVFGGAQVDVFVFESGSVQCSGDIDLDGILNSCDVDYTNGNDCNNDNVDDQCQLDADEDGLIDDCDPDIDGDGIPNECDATTSAFEDCDNSGVADSCEIDQGLLSDCDLNGVPDNCEYTSAEDCNSNGLLDSCDILVGISQDCSGNGIPDECEIQSGSVADCNSNGVPDQCDYLTDPDCNSNGILDSCDIGLGIDTDCDLNGIPDLCDLLAGGDCNSNGVLDACDISGGFSEDCDGNQVPDSCDIAGGEADDDSNGIPDGCEPQAFRRGDLNTDGTMDVSDAVFGLEFLFGTQTVTCEDAADANDDGSLNIGDAVFILSALFNSGDLPPSPGAQSCGLDPTADSLGCEVYVGCP